MTQYETIALHELRVWQKEMVQRPSMFNRFSKRLQTKINSYIPERIHKVLTTTIKQMIRGVLFGAEHLTRQPLQFSSWMEREETVMRKINGYKHAAAAE